MALAVLFRALFTRRKIQFAAIGLTAMAVSYGSLYLLVDICHVNAIAAYIVQAVLAIEVNFILNSKLTWSDRDGGFWRTWWRFHATRVVMVPLNQILFTGLVWTGVNYLIANTICIAATMVINYMLGDRFIFTRQTLPEEADGEQRDLPEGAAPFLIRNVLPLRRNEWQPRVSVVVPVKNSQDTIKPLVQSLLAQDYAGEIEIILVGDIGDRTWSALEPELHHGRVIVYEADIQAPKRDANAKRRIGLEKATGEVLALTDSDMQLPLTWVRTAVTMLAGKDKAVAGSMISVVDGFWGRYVDKNTFLSKTPRMERRYVLTEDNFGRGHCKPPVTANFACTREVHERVGGPPANFSYSYEDYPWFRMIVEAGYTIRCDHQLAAHHSHRSGFKSLMREYRRSGWGCADYLTVYPRCALARKRLAQLALLVGIGIAGLAAMAWLPLFVLGVVGGGVLVVSTASVVRARVVAAAVFPMCTLVLGACFAAGMLMRLARQGWHAPVPVTVTAVRELTPTMAAWGTR
jgi:succinoglycan biosynthesis protein ExoA